MKEGEITQDSMTSAVPTGLNTILYRVPTVKTVGYCQMPFRDKDRSCFATSCQETALFERREIKMRKRHIST
jgi:hypothetical protein